MRIKPEKKILITLEEKGLVLSFSNLFKLKDYIKNKDINFFKLHEHLFNNDEKFLNWLKHETDYDVTISTLLKY